MQAFSAWIHICAIRLFTESILRYGLPPKFLGCLLKPNPKNTAKLRKLLGSMFGSNGALPSAKQYTDAALPCLISGMRTTYAGTKQYYDGDASGGAAASVGDTEMFPYVSFTISIDG